MTTANESMQSDIGDTWRLRYWAISAGQGSSLVGSALTQFVLLWWITDTTGSVSSLAYASIAALLPQALLSPLGGTLADRYSRRVIMIAADAVSACCMVVLIAIFAADAIEVHHLYIMMAIRSAMQAFQSPAATASVSSLVPATFLVRASGVSQTIQSLTLVAAAPLGALAVATMPIVWALAIDVVTALLAIVSLLCFRFPDRVNHNEETGSLWRDFRAGVALVWRYRGLRQLFAIIGGVVLVVMPVFTMVPLLVKTHFGGGASEVGLLEGLAGVGMLTGGMLVFALAPRKHVIWILVGLAISSLAIALTALAPPNLFGVAIAWWVISGLSFSMANGPLTALLLRIVAPEFQGRVISILNTVMGLAGPVGLAIFSPLGEAFGIQCLFVIAGVLGTAVSVIGFWLAPLRALDKGLL